MKQTTLNGKILLASLSLTLAATTLGAGSATASSTGIQSSIDSSTDQPEKKKPARDKKQQRKAKRHFERGIKYKKKDDPGRALVEFLEATKADPEHTDAYYEQALIFRDKGFFKLASSRLEQALAITPSF